MANGDSAMDGLDIRGSWYGVKFCKMYCQVIKSTERILSHKTEKIRNLPLELSLIIICSVEMMRKLCHQYSTLIKMMVTMKEIANRNSSSDEKNRQ